MSEVKVNKISPRTNCGTVTLGDSGDTFTIPSGATITNNGTANGFGATGAVNWQTTPKTATFTAVDGEGYFCNTGGGAFEMDLPAGSAGAIVSVQDYNNDFDSNALTVDPNGSEKINGGVAGETINLDTAGLGITFVYIDSTVGWRSIQSNEYATKGGTFVTATGGTITTCGNDKIHTFTGPGTFTVSQVSPCAANNEVSYMVVAGGGAGGSGYQSGGGGAGGFRETKSPVTPYTASPLDGQPSAPNRITVTATGYPIAVGGGGTAPTTDCEAGGNGNPSVFSTITATAGGGGGAHTNPLTPESTGKDGGSGGGAGRRNSALCGGSGNTPSVTPAQGSDGGDTATPYLNPYSGAGGGGATAVGTNTSATTVGPGGAGATTSISGSPTAYAGGGGGGGYASPAASSGAPDRGAGGTGGGGNGAAGTAAAAAAGTANTGGGGGGSAITTPGTDVGGSGGSGIVIIRYKFQ
tara:strand:+ start:2330 stop:3733 length:1404 start_codon:yes stop_codon:yes gene_type:complete